MTRGKFVKWQKNSMSSKALRIIMAIALVLMLVPAAGLSYFKANAADDTNESDTTTTQEQTEKPNVGPTFETNKGNAIRQKAAENGTYNNYVESDDAELFESENTDEAVANDSDVIINVPASPVTLYKWNDLTEKYEACQEAQTISQVTDASISEDATLGSEVLTISDEGGVISKYLAEDSSGEIAHWYDVNNSKFLGVGTVTVPLAGLELTPKLYTQQVSTVVPQTCEHGSIVLQQTGEESTIPYGTVFTQSKDTFTFTYNEETWISYKAEPESKTTYSVKSIWATKDSSGTQIIPSESTITRETVYLWATFTQGDVEVTFAVNPQEGGYWTNETLTVEKGTSYTVSKNTVTFEGESPNTATAADGYDFALLADKDGKKISDGTYTATGSFAITAYFQKKAKVSVTFDNDYIKGFTTLRLKTAGWNAVSDDDNTTYYKYFYTGESITNIVEGFNIVNVVIEPEDKTYKGVYYSGEETTLQGDIELEALYTFKITAIGSAAGTYEFSNTEVPNYDFVTATYTVNDNKITFTNASIYYSDTRKVYSIDDFTLEASANDGFKFQQWAVYSGTGDLSVNTNFEGEFSVELTLNIVPENGGKLSATSGAAASKYDVVYKSVPTVDTAAKTLEIEYYKDGVKSLETLTAEVNPGYSFTGFGNLPATFTSAVTATVNFEPSTLSATVELAGGAPGTIEFVPSGTTSPISVKYNSTWAIDETSGILTIVNKDVSTESTIKVTPTPNTATDTTKYYFDAWEVTASGTPITLLSGTFTEDLVFKAKFGTQYSITMHYTDGAPSSTGSFESLGWTYDSTEKTAKQFFDEGSAISEIFEEYWDENCEPVLAGHTAKWQPDFAETLTSAQSYYAKYTADKVAYSVAANPEEGGSVEISSFQPNEATYGDTIYIDSTTNNLYIKHTEGTTTTTVAQLTPKANNAWHFDSWSAKDKDGNDITDAVKTNGITQETVFVAKFAQNMINVTFGKEYLQDGSIKHGKAGTAGTSTTDTLTIQIPEGYTWGTDKTDTTQKQQDTVVFYEADGETPYYWVQAMPSETKPYALISDSNAHILAAGDTGTITAATNFYPTIYAQTDTVSISGSINDENLGSVELRNSTGTKIEDISTAKPIKAEQQTVSETVHNLQITTDFNNIYYVHTELNSSAASGTVFLGWAYSTKKVDGQWANYTWLNNSSIILDTNVDFKAVYATYVDVTFKVAEGQSDLGKVVGDTTIRVPKSENTTYTIDGDTVTIANTNIFYSKTIKAEAISPNYFNKWTTTGTTGTITSDTVFTAHFYHGYKAIMDAGEKASFVGTPSGWTKDTTGVRTTYTKYFVEDTNYTTILGEWTAATEYTPVKTGYTFSAWTPAAGTLTADNTTFTATYTANLYKMSIYTKGGTPTQIGGNWSHDSTTGAYVNSTDFHYDDTIASVTADFLAKCGTLTREKYTFTGNFSSSETGTTITGNTDFTALYTYTIKVGAGDNGKVAPTDPFSPVDEGNYVAPTISSTGDLTLKDTQGKMTSKTYVPTANEGYTFKNWTDDQGNVITDNFHFYQDTTITANFTYIKYNVKAEAAQYSNWQHQASDAGKVTVSANPAVVTHFSTIAEDTTTHVITITSRDGKIVTITPSALKNYKFSKWTVKKADGTTVDLSTVITSGYDNNMTFIANFERDLTVLRIDDYALGDISVTVLEYRSDETSKEHTAGFPFDIDLQKGSVVTMAEWGDALYPTVMNIVEPCGNVYSLQVYNKSSKAHTMFWLTDDKGVSGASEIIGFDSEFVLDGSTDYVKFFASGFFNEDICLLNYLPKASTLGTVTASDQTSKTQFSWVETNTTATVSDYNGFGENALTLNKGAAGTITYTAKATNGTGAYDNAFIGWKAYTADGNWSWIEYSTSGSTTYKVTDDTTFEAVFSQVYTVTPAADPSGFGSVDPSAAFYVPSGSQFAVDSADNSKLIVSNNDSGLGFTKTLQATANEGRHVLNWSANDVVKSTGTILEDTTLQVNFVTNEYDVKFSVNDSIYGSVYTDPEENPKAIEHFTTFTVGSGISKNVVTLTGADGKQVYLGSATPSPQSEWATFSFYKWAIKYADGTSELVDPEVGATGTITQATEFEAIFVVDYTRYTVKATVDTGEYVEPTGKETTVSPVAGYDDIPYGSTLAYEGHTVYIWPKDGAEEVRTIVCNVGDYSVQTQWLMNGEVMEENHIYSTEGDVNLTAVIQQGTILSGYVYEQFTGYYLGDAELTFKYDDEEEPSFSVVKKAVAYADGSNSLSGQTVGPVYSSSEKESLGYYEFSDPALLTGKSGTLTVTHQGYDTVTKHLTLTAGHMTEQVSVDAVSATVDLFSESEGHDFFNISYKGTLTETTGPINSQQAEWLTTVPAAQDETKSGKNLGTIFYIGSDKIKTYYSTDNDTPQEALVSEDGDTSSSNIYWEENEIIPVAQEGWEFSHFEWNGHTVGEGAEFEVAKDQEYSIKAVYTNPNADALGAGTSGKTGDSNWILFLIAGLVLVAAGAGVGYGLYRKNKGKNAPKSNTGYTPKH